MQIEMANAMVTVETALSAETNPTERERLLERRACLRKGLERIAAQERTTK